MPVLPPVPDAVTQSGSSTSNTSPLPSDTSLNINPPFSRDQSVNVFNKKLIDAISDLKLQVNVLKLKLSAMTDRVGDLENISIELEDTQLENLYSWRNLTPFLIFALESQQFARTKVAILLPSKILIFKINTITILMLL